MPAVIGRTDTVAVPTNRGDNNAADMVHLQAFPVSYTASPSVTCAAVLSLSLLMLLLPGGRESRCDYTMLPPPTAADLSRRQPFVLSDSEGGG